MASFKEEMKELKEEYLEKFQKVVGRMVGDSKEERSGQVVSQRGKVSSKKFEFPTLFQTVYNGAEGWDKMLHYKEDDFEELKVWKRQVTVDDKEITEFLVHGKTKHAAQNFFETSFTDMDRKWDASLEELVVLEKYKTEHNIKKIAAYWVLRFPYPLSYRSYVFHRYATKVNGTYMGAAIATTHDEAPKNNKYVNVETYKSFIAVRPYEEGSEFVFRMLEDPKLAIPQFLLDWGTQKFMPRLKKDLDAECTRRVVEKKFS